MSLQTIHLRKLLRVFYSTPPKRIALLRNDIREDIAREQLGPNTGGADYYGPFWYDAKEHVIGHTDLHESVQLRIDSNSGRENLYPQLRDGFLLWWNERRRWTNGPFEPINAPKGRFRFPLLHATVKVENFLAVRDAGGEKHFIYPYFSPEPLIENEAARIGLWLIGRAVPELNWDEIRLLDVIRGRTFDADRTPILGNEEAIFTRRYAQAITQWNELRQEY